MNIERTYSKELIKTIMFDEGLLATTMNGDVDVENVEIEPEKKCYLIATDEDGVLGVSLFDAVNGHVVEYHPNLLPQHRGVKSEEFTTKSLEWIYNYAPMYKKVNVKIPCCYPHIEKYAKRVGFKSEGIDRQSFCKDGKLVDQWTMGITRQEIKAELCHL